jgi:protein-disulfide isomerase
MAVSHKKLYIVLVVFISIFTLLLIRQLYRTSTIVVTHSKEYLISPSTYIIPSDPEDQVFGNPGALLTITEFNDIGCSECKVLHETLMNFVNAHPKEARLVWKDFPHQGIIFKSNNLTHQAAYCAGKQQQFWKFVDATMQSSKNRSEAGLKQVATDLKLNTTTWWECTTNKQTEDKIASSVAIGKQLGLTLPPALFINNKRINIAIKEIDLNQLLNTLLAP